MKSDYIETPYGLFSTHLKGAKLSEICDSVNGIQTGPFGSQLHQADYVPSGIPIITVEHLGDNRILHENVPCVNEKDYRRLIKYRLEKGDIVFSRVGSVDRRALVRQDEDGWLFSGRCLRVRPDSEAIDSEYLSWFFGATPFQDHIRKIAVGATMPSLNTKILSDLPIYFPPLPEQKAIARILSSLDDKIELNRRMNATLEQMAQALFRAWFVDFEPVKAKAAGLQPTSADAQTAALFPSELVESELGLIPEGWRVGTLKGCCERVENGGTPRRDNHSYWSPQEIPWLTSGEVRQKIILATENFISWQGLQNSSAKIWPKKTTIIALYGATAGQVAFLGTEVSANQANCALIPRPNWSSYVYLFSNSSIKAFEKQATGSAQQNLSQKIIADFPCILPPEPVIGVFEEIVTPLFDNWLVNLRESQTLTQLRDTLLPRLISGRLRVPEAEKIISET